MRQDERPDYEKLREIMARQFERDVTLEEATGAGNFLLRIYEILLA